MSENLAVVEVETPSETQVLGSESTETQVSIKEPSAKKPRKPRKKKQVVAPTKAKPLNAVQKEAAENLEKTMCAASVSFRWWGIKRSFSDEQLDIVADEFNADPNMISAARSIIDTSDPVYMKLTSARNSIKKYFDSVSLPFSVKGIRLIEQHKVDEVHLKLQEFQKKFQDAAKALTVHYPKLRESAKIKLRDLYDERHYPETLENMFNVTWTFPNIEPPDFLIKFSPKAYEEQRRRVVANFEESVRKIEEMWVAEFGKLVNHLIDRLGGKTGEKKKFSDSTVNNLLDFFAKFKTMNIGSSPELEKIINSAEKLVSGYSPDVLRLSGDLRRQINERLDVVKTELSKLEIAKPSRVVEID